MKKCGIYKITSPSGKIYIGQSTDIDKRFKRYKQVTQCVHQIALKNSFNKYGVLNHLFEVIEECSSEKLNERERYWQDFYNVLTNGLNCKLTSITDKSGVLSEETKKRIGLGNKGKIMTPEQRLKISLGKSGKKTKPLSEKHKNVLSERKKGKPLSDFHKKRISDGRKGKMAGGNHPMAVKVVNVINNEIFNSAKEAWLKYYKNDYSYPYFKSMLNGRSKNKTNFRHLEKITNNSIKIIKVL